MACVCGGYPHVEVCEIEVIFHIGVFVFFCFCFNVVEVISNEVPTSINITILSNFTNW